MRCRDCGNEHTPATSSMTGCCNGERMARGYAPIQGLLYANGTLSPEPPTSSSETRTYAELLTSGLTESYRARGNTGGLTTAQDQMPEPGLGISGKLASSPTKGHISKSGAYSADLKRCPLCNRVPRLDSYEDTLAQNGTWVIECVECGLELTTYFIMEGNPGADKRKMLTLAVRRWNRRVKMKGMVIA